MAFPPQTKYIVGNEACERFSFYGMKSILVLYMVNALAMSESEAMEVAHLFTALIYVLPLLGAWIADRFLGRYRTILYVSLFYCLGHGVLATADLTSSLEIKRMILMTGLFIIALGAGGIKPCVSAFVGDQVGGFDSKTMTRVYAAFYWAINFGSFFSFLVIPWIHKNWGYSWAFAIPGIFMALATFVFWCGRKQYLHKAPAQPEFLPALFCRIFRGAKVACDRFGGEAVSKATTTALQVGVFIVVAPIVIGLAVWAQDGATQLATLSGLSATAADFCGLIALLLYVAALVLAAMKAAATFRMQNFFGTTGSMVFNKRHVTEQLYTEEQRKEARNMLRVLTVFLLIIPFWSLFDQTSTSWILQGRDMKELHFTLFGVSFFFGAEEMQSINPAFVMTLVPLVTLFVYPYIGKWSHPLKRMGIGIILAGGAYGIVAWLQSRIVAGEQLSILWQIIPYFVITVAEILVSTTGIEYAYTAAGDKLKSTVSSFWFLTSTLGNFLVIYLTGIVDDPASTSTFLLYGALSVVIGLIFILVTTRPGFKAE
ncbi:MAG: MFS transporter [Akkermansia sp.]|nr:MFS transporter [Akkermansia sp.]